MNINNTKKHKLIKIIFHDGLYFELIGILRQVEDELEELYYRANDDFIHVASISGVYRTDRDTLNSIWYQGNEDSKTPYSSIVVELEISYSTFTDKGAELLNDKDTDALLCEICEDFLKKLHELGYKCVAGWE